MSQRLHIFSQPLPPGYRDELNALLAERAPQPARHIDSMLLFQLCGLRLALPTRVAFAVAPVLHIAPIPHRSGTVLLGIAAFRGEILPCCSLSRILDLAQSGRATQQAIARTLVLQEAPRRLWAVPIDGILGVRNAAVEPSSTLQTPIGQQWLRGGFEDSDGTFYLLDHEVLFRQINLATA